MLAYALRRILLMVPTLFGIIVINFVIVQFAPGGPVEQMIAAAQRPRQRHRPRHRRRRRAGERAGGDAGLARPRSRTAGRLNKMFGFDKPPGERFWIMMGDYLRFDFGRSFFRDQPVLQADRAEAAGVDLARPVVHAAGLPDLHPARHRQGGARRLALRRRDQRRGAGRLRHPGFLFAILLVVLFAGGSFLHWFPLRGLTSDGLVAAGVLPARVVDYLWHMVLPIDRARGRRLRQPDHADQELLPGGDPQAIRRDRARQGRRASAACCTATCSATPCC